MSPTSYQTAPPRNSIITMLLGGVKPRSLVRTLNRRSIVGFLNNYPSALVTAPPRSLSRHPTSAWRLQRLLVPFASNRFTTEKYRLRSISGGLYAEEGRHQPSNHNQCAASDSPARQGNSSLRLSFACAAARTGRRCAPGNDR